MATARSERHTNTPDWWEERFHAAALDPAQWLSALGTLADAIGSHCEQCDQRQPLTLTEEDGEYLRLS